MKYNPCLSFITLCFVLTAGCARIPLQEISDARVLMEAAKSSCARVYMAEEMETAKEKIRLIDEGTQKKTRRPKRELRELAFDVQRLSKKMINETSRVKSDLYAQIQQKIVLAIKMIHQGEKVEANRYARKAYREAIASVREARQLSQDECKYPEAMVKAEESLELTEQLAHRSVSFKKELEQKLPNYHIVQDGETLKSIAKSSPLYKDESYWEAIYKANRDQIRDPHQLYPGQQLYLPGKK